MNVPKKILVGLAADDSGQAPSEGSLAAARQAFWLGGRVDARVEFLHSTYGDERPAGGPGDLPEGLRRGLEALKAEHGEGVGKVTVRVTDERPWMAMIQAALAGEADLIVVGKRNQSRKDDRRLGSVSMKLVRKCPVPVWVVRPDHDAEHRVIVAATDLSGVGDLATDYAAFLAESIGCELVVAHAWQIPMDLQLGAARLDGEETARRKAAIVEDARARIVSRPGVARLGERARVCLACDTPSHVILDLAERLNPDLAVLGTVSRGGVPGLLVGNTAERLLYKLDCSLLTVKPDDFICPLERSSRADGSSTTQV